MPPPFQSDHEQRALLVRGILTRCFPAFTRDHAETYAIVEQHAEMAVDAILGVQDAYNVAKANGATEFTISTRHAATLLGIASNFYGMDPEAG